MAGWQKQGHAGHVVPRTYRSKVGLIDLRKKKKRAKNKKKEKRKKMKGKREKTRRLKKRRKESEKKASCVVKKMDNFIFLISKA